jgi:SAM-dependent methyltransferase
MNPDEKELVCPHCRIPLARATSGARCPACGAEYAGEEGVLRTDGSEAFLGEFDAERMAEYTQLARAEGWRKAVDHMAREAPGVAPLLLDGRRGSFIDLLGLGRQHRRAVLDLGAGLGAISLKLSESFERVYAVDQASPRLAFLRVIADQERRPSIIPVCHRDILRLPFASGSLDAAVMVGVFEYFPLGYPGRPIEAVQTGALREIQRVLAPGGVLFLATKNRYGWPHWLGARDNSGLRFGSLLPRALADRLSRAVSGQPFRVVTDSLHRYRNLLGQAGFGRAEFYWPIGGYQTPEAWVNLADREDISRGIDQHISGTIKRSLLRLLAAAGILPYLVPHFGIVATKPPTRTPTEITRESQAPPPEQLRAGAGR